MKPRCLGKVGAIRDKAVAQSRLASATELSAIPSLDSEESRSCDVSPHPELSGFGFDPDALVFGYNADRR